MAGEPINQRCRLFAHTETQKNPAYVILCAWIWTAVQHYQRSFAPQSHAHYQETERCAISGRSWRDAEEVVSANKDAPAGLGKRAAHQAPHFGPQ